MRRPVKNVVTFGGIRFDRAGSGFTICPQSTVATR